MGTGPLNGSSLCVFITVRPWMPPLPSCSPTQLPSSLFWWVLVMMVELEAGGGGLPLSLPVVCSRCGGLSVALHSLYCAMHFFFLSFTTYSKKKKKWLCFTCIGQSPWCQPPPETSQEALGGIAAHRLRGAHCCWIIEEFEWKRQGREGCLYFISKGDSG